MIPENVEVAIRRMRTLADSALGSLYEVECQREMRNACVLLEEAYKAAPATCDLVARLRQRATYAREEHTGTADGDAVHFDEAANEIERLSRSSADTAELDFSDALTSKIMGAARLHTHDHEMAYSITRDVLAVLSSHLPQSSGVWQPITTAPRDGKSILVSIAGGADGPHWVVFWNGQFFEDVENGSSMADSADIWMAIPNTPALTRPHGD